MKQARAPACFRSFRTWAAVALLLLGLSQMAGDALGLDWLRGIGAVSVAAPLPRVFSDVRGLETFASRFELEVETASGVERREIDPELYSRLGGPYNRRNVYGAALSYAPRLPQRLWRQVFCYGFASGGPLRRELGVPDDARAVRVYITTRTRGRRQAWILEPRCVD